MCTVSWLNNSDGYDLFFSRDELRTRSIALPPEIHLSESMPYIAPIDPDGGGTWIAVNSSGVCLFLLNNYQSSYMPTAVSRKSRGLICDALIHHKSSIDVEDHLMTLDLQAYQPFSFGIIEPEKSCAVFNWDGKQLNRRISATSPLASSSSPHWQEIKLWRRE
ncbi:MAG: NRDE family protein, partial [Calditrichota bacterium]